MGQFWTKKKEDSKDKETLQVEDFLERLTKHKEESKRDSPKIENTK